MALGLRIYWNDSHNEVRIVVINGDSWDSKLTIIVISSDKW